MSKSNDRSDDRVIEGRRAIEDRVNKVINVFRQR